MDWNLAVVWLAVALLLGLAELASGALVLLGLAVAAALTALVAFLDAPISLQLLSLGVSSGVLVPLAIKWLRPRFSPKGVAYGTTGSGVEKGRIYVTCRRDFDDASGIKVNGDFYRLRISDTNVTELPEGASVVFKEFDGTTAIVSLASQQER